jgi:hypothetical protein
LRGERFWSAKKGADENRDGKPKVCPLPEFFSVVRTHKSVCFLPFGVKRFLYLCTGSDARTALKFGAVARFLGAVSASKTDKRLSQAVFSASICMCATISPRVMVTGSLFWFAQNGSSIITATAIA